MGDTLTLTAADGHRFNAYRAAPTGTPRGALVVIQEIFGVNQHIRNMADRFAAEGYVAVAPALFDRVERGFESGYTAADIERGKAVRGKLAVDDALTDIRAVVADLQKTGLKIGVVGYCFGGLMTWLSATRIDGLAAGSSYYGGTIGDYAQERPRCPVILHFGETDAAIPPEQYQKVAAAHPELPLYTYPAGHGFACDERGSFHEPSARLARERTLEFFGRHVGS